jgi:hypothetical protein
MRHVTYIGETGERKPKTGEANNGWRSWRIKVNQTDQSSLGPWERLFAGVGRIGAETQPPHRVSAGTKFRHRADREARG